MKTQQTKKLFVSFLLAIFFITILIFNTGCQKETTTTGSSKIVYTDVKPDTTVSNGAYHLDLNNDGIEDFNIFAGSINGHCPPDVYPVALPNVSFVEVICYDANSFGDSTLAPGTAHLPVPLGSGTEINQNLMMWTNIVGIFRLHNTCGTSYGLWRLNTDQYLPLRLVVGSSVYFGWVRISIQLTFSGAIPAFHFTIKDYAYNSIANQPILAGQTK
jgi:hypothetical protein